MLAARPGTIYLCSVVLGELIFGAIRSGPGMEPGNREMIADLMAQFVVLPFDEPAAEEYGQLRAHLTAVGQLIGPNDMMIAAIALANRLTLVTHNTSEFNRVPRLVVEDWQ
jgi:tRNA(fMet)-specific endonuclease VapC